MNSEQTAALHDARQALHCLNLEAPASVVRDISAKVEAAFAALSKPVPAADVATMECERRQKLTKELGDALLGLHKLVIRMRGNYPLPQCDGYAEMRAADLALACIDAGDVPESAFPTPSCFPQQGGPMSNPAPAPSAADVMRGAIQRFLGAIISRSGNKAVFEYGDVLGLQDAATVIEQPSTSPAPSRDSGKCGRCAKPADVYATKSGYGYLCAWCMQCEIIALQAKVEKLSAVQPSRDSGLREAGLDAIRQWWTLVEAQAELSEDGPLEDGNIALHFMGSGASASVTVGQVRAALAASHVDDDVAPWLSAMIEDGASCREFIQSAERFIAALQAVKQ